MLRYLRNRRAQAILGEYVLVIFVAVAAMVAMTVYFKRTVQGRIHDARDYMVGEVRVRTAGLFNGNLYKEYEPYYGNTIATVSRRANDTVRILPGGTSGIFQKVFNHTTSVNSFSETAPPREFDATTPVN